MTRLRSWTTGLRSWTTRLRSRMTGLRNWMTPLRSWKARLRSRKTPLRSGEAPLASRRARPAAPLSPRRTPGAGRQRVVHWAMPPRLLRRCLLFGLLGLVTSVVVAWGVSLNWQLRSARYSERGLGVAIVGNTTGSVVVSYGLATEREIWQVHKASERAMLEFAERGEDILSLYRSVTIDRINWGIDRPPLTHNLDARARRQLPRVLSRMSDEEMGAVRYTSGWPRLALRHSFFGDELDISASRSALPISANWAPRASFAKATGFLFVPLQPRPGLLLNTIFYGLLWAGLLLAPGAIRRRIRRARGRCPTCGYSLRGQPAPGCPECGHGREAVGTRPQPAAKRQGGPAPA